MSMARHGPSPTSAQSERERVIGALGPSPVDIDELIRTTGLETRKVHIVLLELDLAGRLQPRSWLELEASSLGSSGRRSMARNCNCALWATSLKPSAGRRYIPRPPCG